MASDWRTKYMDIRAKLKEATDVAWRLGYERGMKDGTQAAQMQAMAQQQQQQAAMMGGAPGGDPSMGGDPSQDPSMQGGDPSMGGAPGGEDQGMEGAAPGAEEMEGADGGGSELDQHINELQGLVSKGEKPTVLSIRRAVEALAGIRKTQKNNWAKKAEKIIPAQKKVVDNILAKWEKEAKKPSEGLEDIIKQHGLKLDE